MFPVYHKYILMKLVSDTETRFYVYKWIDPRTGVPFYIGKGSWDRKYKLHKTQRCYYKLKSLLNQGCKKLDIVKVIKEGLYEEEALDLESYYINIYKRLEDGGTLFNYEAGRGCLTGMKNKIIDKDKISQIIKQYEDGLNAKQIGSNFNCHETTILRYLRQNNIIPREPGWHYIPLEEYSKIGGLYNSGYNTVSLSKKYNCSIPTITMILRKQGINIRSRGLWDKGIFNDAKITDKIIKDYKNNKCIQHIAIDYNISAQVLTNFLIKNNIHIRKSRAKKCGSN